MIIKKLDKQDFETAKQLYCDCFHKSYQKTTIPLTGTIIGLYLETELIGIAQMDYINNVFDNKKICYINSFCIKKEYRHQGYGNKLLNECLKIAHDNQANMINMTSNKNRIYAHMLYQKNNFEPINTILLKKDL